MAGGLDDWLRARLRVRSGLGRRFVVSVAEQFDEAALGEAILLTGEGFENVVGLAPCDGELHVDDGGGSSGGY